MIVRVFRAMVRAGSAGDFEDVVRSTSLTRFEDAPGLVSWVAGRPLGATGEFCVVTVWEDLDSLQRFAGPDWQRENVLPAEALPLLEETILHHYEVFGSSPSS
jgi:heme-degrading monooxygenase HmoA